MRNGEAVATFEREFAAYVGARYAVALCNGTATLHTALIALGVKPGDRVAVPPLTMSATTLAVLHAGAVPVFVDVDPKTWLYARTPVAHRSASVVVDLYGLHGPWTSRLTVVDGAQTLRPHIPDTAFTSYSFQASKILPLGEGGMLVTNDEALAVRAREFSSLGYRMRADQPRIDPDALKSPWFERHHSIGWNYRMSDLVAERGLEILPLADFALARRRARAALYRDAIAGCSWAQPQHVPDGWAHDYWSFAICVHDRFDADFQMGELQPNLAKNAGRRALELSAAIVKHGGEKPYPAWLLTYKEPALKHLAPRVGVCERCGHNEGYTSTGGTHRCRRCDTLWQTAKGCRVAEYLQPRLLQMQTNSLASAQRNAVALKRAIEEVGG